MFNDVERIVFMAFIVVKTMRFSVWFFIKLSLTSGISDIKIGQKSGNFDSNFTSKGSKSHTDFCQKNGIGFF